MELILSISISLMAGLLMTRVIKPLKLPAVTAYLLAGILVGPYVLGRLGIPGVGFGSIAEVKGLSLISNIALGFIAFSIGNEFRLSQLKETGKKSVIIAIFESLGAAILVDAALIGLHFLLGEKTLPLSVAITLGAIATATAPAATLMVVKQYKAKGKLTDILLPVVALDDAVCLIVFSVSFGVAKAMSHGVADVASIIAQPLIELAASILLGALIGIVFSFTERFFHSNSKRMSLAVTFILLTVAISMTTWDIPGTNLQISFSSLLVCMMLATVFCNTCDFSLELMDKTEKWTAPLFALFFVLSGAELELDVFRSATVVFIGVVYILFRSLGKYFGATLGAKLMGCDHNTVKYLGVTLLPQAGVALGMSMLATDLPNGALIRNTILFGVLIYELFGPLLTKIALTKAGEITPPKEPSLRAQGKVVHDLHR